jgi:hypothetical protein
MIKSAAVKVTAARRDGYSVTGWMKVGCSGMVFLNRYGLAVFFCCELASRRYRTTVRVGAANGCP